MNCHSVEDLFSALVDDTLPAPQLAAVDRHLASCARCRADYDRFTAAVDALQTQAPAPAPAGHTAAVLTAVGAAAHAQATADDITFAKTMRRAAQETDQRERRRAAGLLAAALLGAAAATALLLLWPRQPRQQLVERIVEVPRDVVREVIREVPRDVVRHVRVVERIEVPTTVEVVRVVPRGPLLTIDAAPVGVGLATLGRELGRSLRAAAAAWHDAQLVARVEPSREPPPQARSAHPPAAQGGASVRVQRFGDKVALETRGALREVVPVLLSALDNPDREVAALVERRLANLRARASADPRLSQRLIEPVERSTGRAAAEDQAATPAQRWGAWWEANGAAVAAAEDRLEL